MELLILGPFTVERDGILRPRVPEAAPALSFSWRGRHCEAAVAQDGLHLAALAGRVPSSAEPGTDRAAAFGTLATLPRSLPPGWRLHLLPDHRIRLEAATDMPASPTATSLLAALVRFALALDPYLDRLESVSAGPVGRLKSCPG
ncbi:hypothetical protein [Roseicella aquatilis]|uniref:Uncharacterized protein n=1 Tax=Roseicella aquatilis TaxID=2527868 RepID=A0A4R4DUJ4_9PROT|nr:hypothetical protein [Roseicella aquatilis]TCZ65927.1 hypothetical protein EXY23_02245 [Roseicella aquatilis]